MSVTWTVSIKASPKPGQGHWVVVRRPVQGGRRKEKTILGHVAGGLDYSLDQAATWILYDAKGVLASGLHSKDGSTGAGRALGFCTDAIRRIAKKIERRIRPGKTSRELLASIGMEDVEGEVLACVLGEAGGGT